MDAYRGPLTPSPVPRTPLPPVPVHTRPPSSPAPQPYAEHAPQYAHEDATPRSRDVHAYDEPPAHELPPPLDYPAPSPSPAYPPAQLVSSPETEPTAGTYESAEDHAPAHDAFQHSHSAAPSVAGHATPSAPTSVLTHAPPIERTAAQSALAPPPPASRPTSTYAPDPAAHAPARPPSRALPALPAPSPRPRAQTHAPAPESRRASVQFLEDAAGPRASGSGSGGSRGSGSGASRSSARRPAAPWPALAARPDVRRGASLYAPAEEQLALYAPAEEQLAQPARALSVNGAPRARGTPFGDRMGGYPWDVPELGRAAGNVVGGFAGAVRDVDGVVRDADGVVRDVEGTVRNAARDVNGLARDAAAGMARDINGLARDATAHLTRDMDGLARDATARVTGEAGGAARTAVQRGMGRMLDYIVPPLTGGAAPLTPGGYDEKASLNTMARERALGERLVPTLTHAKAELSACRVKTRWTGYVLNVCIGLQVVLGAMTTGVAAATTGRASQIGVTVLGGLSTLAASYLARARGSGEPEASAGRCRDLENFIRECEAFVLDRGHIVGGELDREVARYRARFEEIMGNDAEPAAPVKRSGSEMS